MSAPSSQTTDTQRVKSSRHAVEAELEEHEPKAVKTSDAAVAVEPLNIDDFAAMSVEQAVAWIKTAARLGEHEAVALRNKRCSGRHLLELEAQDYTALGLDDVSGLLIYRVVEKWRAAHSATPLTPPSVVIPAGLAAQALASPPTVSAAALPPIVISDLPVFRAQLAASGLLLRSEADRLKAPEHILPPSGDVDLPFVARFQDINTIYAKAKKPSTSMRSAVSVAIQASPGFGKTRFFLEFMRRAQPPPGVRFVFAPVTFNSGTPWMTATEGSLRPDQAIGYRMLYAHFVDPGCPWARFLDWIRRAAHVGVIVGAAQCIASDVSDLSPSADRSQVILLIDELARLDPGTARPTDGLSAAHAAMGEMWTPTFRRLLVLVSSLSPLSKAGDPTPSGQRMYWHRLTPLSQADVETLLPNELCSTPMLRLVRSDACGHPRIIAIIRLLVTTRPQLRDCKSYETLISHLYSDFQQWGLGNLGALSDEHLLEALLVGRSMLLTAPVAGGHTVDDLIGDGTLLHLGVNRYDGSVVPRISLLVLWRWACYVTKNSQHSTTLASIFHAMFQDWASEARVSGEAVKDPWGEPYERFHSQFLLLQGVVSKVKVVLAHHPGATSFALAASLEKHWRIFPGEEYCHTLDSLFKDYDRVILDIGASCPGFDLLEFTKAGPQWKMKPIQLKAGLDGNVPLPSVVYKPVCDTICAIAPYMSNRSRLLRLLAPFFNSPLVHKFTHQEQGLTQLDDAKIRASKDADAVVLRKVLDACQDGVPTPCVLPDIDGGQVTFEFLSLCQAPVTERQWASGQSAAHCSVRVMVWDGLKELYGPNLTSRLEFYVAEKKRAKELALARQVSEARQ